MPQGESPIIMVCHNCLCCINRWMKFKRRVEVHPIQVHSPFIGAIMTPFDTVWVQKGDELEHITVPQH